MTIRRLLTGAAALAILTAPGSAFAQNNSEAARADAEANWDAANFETAQAEHDKLFALFADSDARSLELNPLSRLFRGSWCVVNCCA